MGDVQLGSCELCKDRLIVFAVDGKNVVYGSDGELHECWKLPDGAELLVLDE